ncbi:hypothetical protein WICPIJ_000381 [Wickerhamomyces pijperi]|uniref:Uncharacterized protein n=1 Tax=Wickerhamomyces pijperi TaxID=599730 RepID=A0A9P8TRW9_WICPI|nr:hypothetical protein WICPIJ_000381 [Wickerhamomyces pijperi]
MYLKAPITERFFGLFGSAVFDCISTLITSIGWFQADKPPPTAEAAIFSRDDNLSSLPLPVAFLMASSANRAKPNLEPQLVICLMATALTPLLIPLIPSLA